MSLKLANLPRKQEAEKERKRIAFAFVLSLLLHIALILFIAIAAQMEGHDPVEPESEATLDIVFTEPEPPSEQEMQRTFVETLESQSTETAPRESAFESDKNTHAASDQAPTGDLPLPSQEGRESTSIEWQDRAYSEGERPREDAVEGKQPAEPAQPQEEPAPTPEGTPAVTPEPTPLPESTPEPVPTPLNTPPPEATPASTALALLDPPVRPSARARPERPKVRPAQPAEQSRPEQPGYQPETRTTRIQGGLTNRGRPALNATATPLGRYKKMLSDAIGSRWYYYVNRQIDLISIGTIEIRFIVDRDGKARSVRVISNTSNESFASVSLRSILEANIPPIPEDVAENLHAGQLEVDYTFTILSN